MNQVSVKIGGRLREVLLVVAVPLTITDAAYAASIPYHTTCYILQALLDLGLVDKIGRGNSKAYQISDAGRMALEGRGERLEVIHILRGHCVSEYPRLGTRAGPDVALREGCTLLWTPILWDADPETGEEDEHRLGYFKAHMLRPIEEAPE